MIGIGLSAKGVEKGGCDLIIIYNSGRFRMAGRGSLAGLMPYGDANQIVVEMVSYATIGAGEFRVIFQWDHQIFLPHAITERS